MEDYNEQLAELQQKLDNIAGTESAKKALDSATKNKKLATTAAEDASKAYDEAEDRAHRGGFYRQGAR